MRLLLVFGCLVAIIGCEDPKLSPERCDLPCYEGPLELAGVGACTRGVQRCDRTGRLLECAGQVMPAAEVCDGVDNDCNGEIDDSLEGAGVGEACGGPLVISRSACRFGTTQCQEGQLMCVGAAGPFAEVCNGLDDDCDGLIDEMEMGQPCYAGNAADLVSGGPCRAGVELCVRAAVRCVGQVLPVPEIECNGIDEDCDGVVDDGQRRDFDIVLYIDRSSSMDDDVPLIQPGMLGFILAHLSDAYRYAIVDVPGPLDGHAWLRTDLVGAQEVLGLLDPILLNGGGLEPSYDALYEVATDEIPLSWRPGARRIDVMFTDEEGQSQTGLDVATVARVLSGAGHVFYGFTPGFASRFREIADQTGGEVFDEKADEARVRELVVLEGDCP